MIQNCPRCGQSLKAFRHRLTPGLVGALIKARRQVSLLNKNSFHIYRDLTGLNTLTTVEQMNWTKLRFHGLVARVREDGKAIRGFWLITKRGGEFLGNKIAIPSWVRTFDNKVIGHSPDRITIREVMSTLPVFQDSFEFDTVDLPDDDYSEGEAMSPPRHKKRGVAYCPKCDIPLQKKMTTEVIPETTQMRIKEKWLECPRCGFNTRPD